MRQLGSQPQPKQKCIPHAVVNGHPRNLVLPAIALSTINPINSSESSSQSAASTLSAPSCLDIPHNGHPSSSKIPQPPSSMLSRTLRHSRSAPSLRALSPGPQQAAQFHSSPAISAAKSAAQTPLGSPIAKGWREKTVVELKAELKRRGLPTSGRKEELVMRLTNANANFGTAEALGATSSTLPTSPTKALKMKKSLPSMKTTSASPFTTPVKAPPVPKIPDMYSAPTVAPVLKLNTQSLTASMTNLRIGSTTMPSSPMNASLLSKSSFANLRAASTLTPTKSSSPTVSPKASRTSVRRQSVTSNNSSSPTRNSSLSSQVQQRHVSTIAPASVLTGKPLPSSAPPSPTKPKSPSKPRLFHTSNQENAMLSDNVHLPTFTAEAPIEIPPVPILPTTRRAPPRIEFVAPVVEQPIVTAAGAHTHPAPPGKGSDMTREHLQSDSSKPKAQRSEEKTGKFEGDWGESASQEQENYKFEPEQGEISSGDKGILWGVVGAATLWGVFGPGKKKGRK